MQVRLSRTYNQLEVVMFENEAEERTKQYMNEYEEKYNCENTKLETDNYNAGLEQGYEDGFFFLLSGCHATKN